MCKTMQKCLECGAAVLMFASTAAPAAASANSRRGHHYRPRIQRQLKRTRRNRRVLRTNKRMTNNKAAKAAKKLPNMSAKSKTQAILISYIHNGKAQIKKVMVHSSTKPQQQEYSKMAATKANYRKLQALNKQILKQGKKTGNKVITPNESLGQAKTHQAYKSQIDVKAGSITLSKSAYKTLKNTTKRLDLAHIAKYMRLPVKQLVTLNHMSATKELNPKKPIKVPTKNPKLEQLVLETLNNATGEAWENYNNKYDHLSRAQVSDKNWIIRHESGGRYWVLADKPSITTHNPFGRWHSTPFGKYQLDPGYLKHDASIANQELTSDWYVLGRHDMARFKKGSDGRTWSGAKRYWKSHKCY